MYVKLDAHFDEHPSHADLELEHFGLIACALAYCLRNLTDGHLPLKSVRGFGKSGKGIKVADQLVGLGKWTRSESGYQITDYLQHNPSRAEVLAKREARAMAGKTGGIRSGASRSKNEANASVVASTDVEPWLKQTTEPMLNTMLNPSLSLSLDLDQRESARAPADAGMNLAFSAGCARVGKNVAPKPFAWKDLSVAAVTHWPGETWEERRKNIESAAARWAERADDFTKRGGYRHSAFIDWLNSGNANVAKAEASRGLNAAQMREKCEREALEIESRILALGAQK
jgi:hypothetical protein